MELIGSGKQADIFIENNFAIKLFKKNVSKNEIEYEMNLQKMAFELGLPVPKIYDIIEINGKYGFQMEYIKGISVGKIILNDTTKIDEYLMKSIYMQININKIVTNKFPLMKEKLQNRIKNVNRLNINEKQILQEKLDQMEFNQNLCHGDFHVMNLIETSKEIKIIDWVDSTSGSIEADIYRTYLLYLINYKEIAENYLKNYCKIAHIQKENVLKWAPIIAASRLTEGMENKENDILLEIVKENM